MIQVSQMVSMRMARHVVKLLLRIDDSHHAQYAMFCLRTVVVDWICIVDGDVEDRRCYAG